MTQTQSPVAFNFNNLSVRAYSDDLGNPWFVANDVCDVLGYRNPWDAVSKHCRADGVAKREVIDSMGRTQEITTINEGNLYRLIIKSRKPEAEPFERWVCDEVLPSIRKTGTYTAPTVITPAQQNTLQQIVAFKSGESGGLRAYCWSRFNNHFHLGSYKQLPAVYFDEAVAYLESMPMKKEPALPPPVTSPLIGQRILTRLEEGGRYSTEIVPVDAYVLTLASFEELLARSGKSIVPTETVNAIKKLQLLAA